MDIIQFKDDLDFEFLDDKDLIKKLKKRYTVDGYTADVEIQGNIIHIHTDDTIYNSVKRDFERATAYCNKGDFSNAEPILRKIIEKCPYHADAIRIIAQIEMEQGKLNEAYNMNLKALAVDPSNLWALILMGNICKRMGNIEDSRIFYNKVLKYHPNNYLAQNNIAANYLQDKEYDKAMELFTKILKRDDTYLNSYYGLALCYYNKFDDEKAVETCVKGMKIGVDLPQNKGVRAEIEKLAMRAAQRYVRKFNSSLEIAMEKSKISKMTDIPLKVEEDAHLPVHARLEYYVSHHRDYNRVVLNPTKEYYEHLLMHEFMHLEMNIEAAKRGHNRIAVSDNQSYQAFSKWIASDMKGLRTRLNERDFENIKRQLFDGLMLQLSNSALDLLVEDRIYSKFPHMRPLQLLSLVKLETGNLESVRNASKYDLPRKVVSTNRILNIVSAMHLNDLYGINIAPQYKANNYEMRVAQDLYEEYKAYKDDYKPGEEYNLTEYFKDSLGLDSDCFKLVNEMHFHEINLPKKEDAPTESTDPIAYKEQNEYFSSQHKDGENETETMMMAMYILGAMKLLKGMPKSDVHRIAIEIAMVGINGINPNNKGYKINALPGKEFGGYEFLAYYYVSWAIAIPEKLDSLGLPFKNAYALAKQMYEKNNR